MATYAQIQSRVSSRVIDLPAAVQTEVPLLVNDAMTWLQARHNFYCMRSEFDVTSTAGNHVLGAIPSDWKEPRGNAFYVLQIGSSREIDWIPNRQFAYRQWDANDPNSKGPPRMLLMGEPVFDGSTPDYGDIADNIEVYPFPDGMSDWTTSPVGEYRVKIPYWRNLPGLVANGDTNWFTQNATRFLVDYATADAFAMDWDEARSGFWREKAIGKYDGTEFRSLGGWARQAINLDSGKAFAPSRTLVPRRDVYAPRDQWRT